MAEKDQDKLPDIVSDQERDIAQNIFIEFKKKNYAACLQLINKLENRTNDLKVVYNKTVLEFYKNDCRKVEQLQKNLASICNQFQIKLDKMDNLDHCVVLFNQAIILFHQQQYTASQKIMDKVYKFIEPMEESLVKQISLLAIELQLKLRQPDKALTLINYLENNLMYGGSIPLKGLDKVSKERKIQLPPPKPLSKEFEKILLKYKLRCYVMNHSLKKAATEIQMLLKDKSNIEAMFLSANIEYLKGNYNDSMKILTAIPVDCLTYSASGESSNVMFYNNMGIIHHSLGKPNLACHYIQTALKEDLKYTQNNSKKEEGEKPLYCLGSTRYHELMYNLGISMLHAKKPAQAFDCLIIAVRRYHRNSRLWLRLAECCIMIHKETNESDFEKQKNLIAEIVGSKEKQRIVLTTNLSTDKKYSSDSQSYAVPVPTLEFASLCLRNASHLVPSETATPPVPLFLIPGVTPPAPPPSPGLHPSNVADGEGVASLRNSVLAASAYVAICLENYVVALEYAKEMLEQPKLSGLHKLLAHLYAAESLVMLDKIPDALNHLNPLNITDISFEFSPCAETDDDEIKLKTKPPFKWFPNNLETVHAVMQYNIAVAKTIRGQLDQATAILKQVWQQRSQICRVPTHIFMLFIYIELQLGRTDVAKNLIRHYPYQKITG